MTAPAAKPKAASKDVGRCAHCASTILERTDEAARGRRRCKTPAGITCEQGPTVYTGPRQLVELGYLHDDGTPTDTGYGHRAPPPPPAPQGVWRDHWRDRGVAPMEADADG